MLIGTDLPAGAARKTSERVRSSWKTRENQNLSLNDEARGENPGDDPPNPTFEETKTSRKCILRD